MNVILVIPATKNTCYDYRWKALEGSDIFGQWGEREKYNACIGQVESTYYARNLYLGTQIIIAIVIFTACAVAVTYWATKDI